MPVRYRLIYADPPWPTPNRRRNAVGPYGTGTHYPLMTRDEILALPVDAWAERSAVLALWCSWPNLPLGLQVIDSWGFKYISGCPWLKISKSNNVHPGLGRWFRECSELLLMGTRGEARPPGEVRLGIVMARRGPVSQKPEEVAEWLEQFPGPRIELFARRKRPGWATWGNRI